MKTLPGAQTFRGVSPTLAASLPVPIWGAEVGISRLGSTLSCFGASRFGSSLAVLDFVACGSALSLRSFSRLGSALTVLDLLCLGSSLSLRAADLRNPRRYRSEGGRDGV